MPTKKTPAARPKRQAAAKKAPAKTSPAKTPKKPAADAKTERAPSLNSRHGIDWAAVERDHALNRYTDTELARMHGITRESIVRRRKRDQEADPTSWSKDLGEQIQRATKVLLTKQAVADAIEQGHVEVTDAVLVEAEVAKQVILGHRKDIKDAKELAAMMLRELRVATTDPDTLLEIWGKFSGADEEQNPHIKRILMQGMNDLVKVDNRVGSLHKLSDTLTKLQTLERRAFSLDNPEEKPKDPPPSPGSISAADAVDAYRQWVNA